MIHILANSSNLFKQHEKGVEDEMMLVKYDLELDDRGTDVDNMSYEEKSCNSLMSESFDEDDHDEFLFSQSMDLLLTRHPIVDQSMNELAGEGYHPILYHFES